MDDNKEKVTPENPEETIKDEMEELAKVFKEELDKVKAEAESDVESLEVDGYNPREVSVKEKAEKDANKKMCALCDEKPAKHGDYCSKCDEFLRESPYDYRGIIAALVMVCVTVAAIFCFAINVPIFSTLKGADKDMRDGKVYTAIAKYTEAASLAEDSGSTKKYLNIYAKSAIANHRVVNLGTALSQISSNIPESALKLLGLKTAGDIYEEIEIMQASAMVAQQHLAKYPETVTKEVYEEIVADLDNLSGKKIYINGSVYHDETEEDFTPTGKEKVVICQDGWLHMYKYAAAQEYGADLSVIAKHLQDCADSSEYLKTLVGSVLAITYAGMGEFEKAEELADYLRDVNCESADPYVITSAVTRYRDKDYEKALEICEDGTEMLKGLPYSQNYLSQNLYMINTQKGLAYIMQGNYDEAYSCITDVYDVVSNGGALTVQIRDLYAVLALETGDDETFEAVKKEIDSYGEDAVQFTDDVINYQAGKLTIQEMVEKGGYDVL